jgi:CBS domain containing-hemolysin-like protein
MITLLVIVWAVACILLLLHESVQLNRAPHSHFELKRRGDTALLRREKLFYSLSSLRSKMAMLLLIVTVAFSLMIWGGWGAVYTAVVIILIQPLSRLAIVARAGHGIYDPQEARILNLIENYSLLGWLVGTTQKSPADQKIESVEQLQHLLETSGSILTVEQQTIIRNGLNWHTVQVNSIMTPVEAIVSIKHTELLGPLVLDDLHRTGHNRFPVIRGTIDTVVGVLDISQLLDVTAGKRSETVEKTMLPQILHIESDQTLPDALAMLQKSHQHMLIVVDADGKTVGLITLSDITGSLLGRLTEK